MQEKIIGIELAKLAKEIGFAEKTFSVYDIKCEDGVHLYTLEEYIRGSYKNDWDECYKNFNTTTVNRWVSAPTQSILQKWILEKYGWHIKIELPWDKFLYKLKKFASSKEISNSGVYYDTYEEALEAGMLHILKILKDNNKEKDKTKYLLERKPKVGDFVEIKIWCPLFNKHGIIIEPHYETRVAKIIEIRGNAIKGSVSNGDISFHKEQIINYFKEDYEQGRNEKTS